MKKYTLISIILLFILGFSKINVEAEVYYNEYPASMSVGDIKDIKEFFPIDEEPDYYITISDEGKIYIDDEKNTITATAPGIVDVYFYYQNGTLCDVYTIEIFMPEAFYKVYTYDENGNKKYLEIVDTVPHGSSLRLANVGRSGLNRIKQVWKFERVGTNNNIFIIRPALDLKCFIKLDVGSGMVFVDSYSDRIHTDTGLLSYYYNEWIVSIAQGDNSFQSAKQVDTNKLIDRYMYCNKDTLEIFANSGSYGEPKQWYFEKVTYFPKELFLYDMYSNSNMTVNERWMGCDGTKSLESLEIFVGIYSDSLTKEEVEWSSSDNSIASVDVNTGIVTTYSAGDVIIKATPKNKLIESKSYILHVLDFKEGVYNIKNIVTNQYLAADDLIAESEINTVNDAEESNTKWYITVNPDGGYGIHLLGYGPDITDDGYDVGRFNLCVNEYNELSLNYFENLNYRDTTCWDIICENAEKSEYCIGIPYIDVDVEYYNYINVIPGTREVFFGNNGNPLYIWQFQEITDEQYYEEVDFAYDIGFTERYNGENGLPNYLEILDVCNETVTNEFQEEFKLCLNIKSDPYELFVSPADLCDKESIYDICPGHRLVVDKNCSNKKTSVPDYYPPKFSRTLLNCTNGAVISWEFRPFGNRSTAVLFCGHNLYDDNKRIENGAYRNSGNFAVMIYSVHGHTPDYANTDGKADLIKQNFVETLMHEMGHAFGTPDHYHRPGGSGDKWTCNSGLMCSVCGVGAYRRSKSCVMNNEYINNYEWCDDCRFDIFFDLSTRYATY